MGQAAARALAAPEINALPAFGHAAKTPIGQGFFPKGADHGLAILKIIKKEIIDIGKRKTVPDIHVRAHI